MASFSYLDPTLDSTSFLPNSPNIKMSGSLEEDDINTTFFSYSYPSELHQEIDVRFHEGIKCMDNSRISLPSDKVPCLIDQNPIGDQQKTIKKRIKTVKKRKKVSKEGPYSSFDQSKCSKEPENKKHDIRITETEEEEKNKVHTDQGTPSGYCENSPTWENGYFHLRARRGQATNNHSLAERVRREKLNDKMKLLQKLVPGCDKVTTKALMLNEIINYIQSLQSQIEFLSMKLASVTPVCYDFAVDLDTIMAKSERKMDCLDSPLSSIDQQFTSTSVDTINTFTAKDNYPFLQPQQEHILPTTFSQGNEKLIPNMNDEIRQRTGMSSINESWFTSLYSFQ